jgi:hypothetical protein
MVHFEWPQTIRSPGLRRNASAFLIATHPESVRESPALTGSHPTHQAAGCGLSFSTLTLTEIMTGLTGNLTS